MTREEQHARSSDAQQFVARYDEMIYDDFAVARWGQTGFYNVGYWSDGVFDQKAACERFMGEHLGTFPRHEGTILDVGCGLGATTGYLCRHYEPSNIVGINISAKQLETCRHNAPHCRFEEMDAAHLEFPDATFDRVISVEAAFHFNTRERFLQEAYRVMKPGAFIVVSDILFLDRRFVGEWMVPPENDLKDVDSYRALWERIGFGDVTIADVTHPCWHGFCDHWIGVLSKRARTGQLDPSVAEQRIAGFRRMRDDAVHRYVLASATRGGAPAASPVSPQMGSK